MSIYYGTPVTQEQVLELRERLILIHGETEKHPQAIIDLIESVTCPITMNIMCDPVVIPCCGKSVSKKPFLTWYKEHNNCPLCRTDILNGENVLKNRTLNDTILAVRTLTGCKEEKGDFFTDEDCIIPAKLLRKHYNLRLIERETELYIVEGPFVKISRIQMNELFDKKQFEQLHADAGDIVDVDLEVFTLVWPE